VNGIEEALSAENAATRDVFSLTVMPGERRRSIGPNGAGRPR